MAHTERGLAAIHVAPEVGSGFEGDLEVVECGVELVPEEGIFTEGVGDIDGGGAGLEVCAALEAWSAVAGR